MSSPTQRALADLREAGYSVAIVEKYNSFTHTRTDLFGLFDILAISDTETLGVQACAGASHAARRTKLLAHENLPRWNAAGRSAWVYSYAKRGARGKRKVWTGRRERLDVHALTAAITAIAKEKK